MSNDMYTIIYVQRYISKHIRIMIYDSQYTNFDIFTMIYEYTYVNTLSECSYMDTHI